MEKTTTPQTAVFEAPYKCWNSGNKSLLISKPPITMRKVIATLVLIGLVGYASALCECLRKQTTQKDIWEKSDVGQLSKFID